MKEVDIPTLKKYGLQIGKAALNGDRKAQKIIRWYSSSQNIGDTHGIALAEILAEAWVKENKIL